MNQKKVKAVQSSFRRGFILPPSQHYETKLAIEGHFCDDQLHMLSFLCAKERMTKDDRLVFTRILTNCFDEQSLLRINLLESCGLFIFKRFISGSKMVMNQNIREMFAMVLRGKAQAIYGDGRRYNFSKGQFIGETQAITNKQLSLINFTKESQLLLIDGQDFKKKIRPQFEKQITNLNKKLAGFHMLSKLPLFERTKIFLQTRKLALRANEFVFRQGDQINYIILIKKGTFMQDQLTVSVDHEAYGIQQLLNGSRKRRFGLRALHQSQIYLIKRKIFFELVKYEQEIFRRKPLRVQTQMPRLATEQDSSPYFTSLQLKQMKVQIGKKRKFINRFRFLSTSERKPVFRNSQERESRTESLMKSIRELAEHGKELIEGM